TKMATFERQDPLNLSMREKSLIKRRVNKEHNSNFRAGYVHINEENLHKTGVRGRKRFVIYILMVLMAIVVLANFIVTVIVFVSLKIDGNGMRYLEFTPPGVLLRFIGESHFDTVVPLEESRVAGLYKEALDISGINGQNVTLSSQGESSSSVTVGNGVTTIKVDNSFQVTDPQTGKTIFKAGKDGVTYPDDINHISMDEVTTDRVASPIDQDLKIQGENVILQGNEGIFGEARSILFRASSPTSNITFGSSTSGKTILDGKEGVTLTKVKSLPSSTIGSTGAATYRLCVCYPSGHLYGVPNGSRCSDIIENPCKD
ncbi:unnamed protein product, partial [Owenia fusiformis]